VEGMTYHAMQQAPVVAMILNKKLDTNSNQKSNESESKTQMSLTKAQTLQIKPKWTKLRRSRRMNHETKL